MFHSNSSPFNQRQPKAGPSVVSLRHHQDPTQRPPMELPNPKRNSTAFTESIAASRPIATNSRVKKDEKYRKDMFLAFINNALLQKAKGTAEPFDELVNQFGPSNSPASSGSGARVPTNQLGLWLSALSHVVSQLERTHSALVEAVIGMPWATMDASFVRAYVAFIGMLVSARPEYLSLVLEKTARGFTFRSGVHATDGCTPDGFSSPLTRRVVYDRLHHLLEHLLSLIPTLPSALQPLLIRNFPHKRQDKADQVTYIRNLLHITEYCPALADRILATIIDRAIQIDVEIQIEMEELDTDVSTRENGDVFVLDPFDTIVGQEGSDSEGDEDDGDDDNLSDLSSDAGGDADDEDSPGEAEQDITHLRDMVAKLDAMLKLLFDHFHRTHGSPTATLRPTSTLYDPLQDISSTTAPSRLPPAPNFAPEQGRDLRRSQFITLLSIFDRTIIRTFKSRYTQFLIFWYSSLDPEFTDMFLGLLVSKVFEETQPIVTRAAASSYVASFVSRAQFVDGASSKRVVSLLCDFLETHLEMCTAMGDAFDPYAPHHTLFYAIAQAVFLIFCFRWRDLQIDDEIEMDDLGVDNTSQKKWIPRLDVMQRVITSALNPLKVCSPNVIQQFARVAQSTGFIYCYTILESNRRPDPHGSNLSTPHASSSSRHTASPAQSILFRDATDADLNTFFPFDPYKLPLSYPYIQGVYREWTSVALDEDEEEEDEEDDNDEEGVHSSSRLPWAIKNVDDDTGALGASFGGMSISPMRPDGSAVSVI